MNEILLTILRSIVSLALLFLLTKWMGRKQISQMTFFDYCIGISIGSIASEIAANADGSISDGITALIVYALIAILISILTNKSIVLRRFFTGTPTILVQNGKWVEKNFKKEKFDINDFLAECRVKDIFDVADIEYAIMESNGRISILPKAEKQPVTPKDLKLDVNPSVLLANVIMDGHILKQNLSRISKSEQWLRERLKQHKLGKPENIFLATCDLEGNLNIHYKFEANNPQDILE